MITLEQFAIIHMSIVMAMGDRQKEIAVCQQHGITIEQWDTGKAFYYAKMADPSDQGRTATAMAAAAMGNLPNMIKAPVVQQPGPPADFTATSVRMYMSDQDVQMIELLSGGHQHVVLQHIPRPDPQDQFLSDYVKGRPHISINEQSYSLYGGVTRVELSSTSVRFVFDEEGAGMMERPAVTVTFAISSKRYVQLKYLLGAMYRGLLQIKPETDGGVHQHEGTTWDLRWERFVSDGNTITIRPNLENIRDRGEHQLVVLPVFNKGRYQNPAADQELVPAMLHALMASMESSLDSVIAFHVDGPQHVRLFIYTKLDQERFMAGISEALVYLPQLPLDFGGGPDAGWNNYNACRQDWLANR